MNTAITRKPNIGSLKIPFHINRGIAFGIIILAALLAFELFNFSTTEFALGDLLGDLSFVGVRWATILAIAFCGIDFAGIARLFTPEEGGNEMKEVWYLFGAWLLAATMNAMLTWWGVSIAILNHNSLGDGVMARETMLRAVPIFVAIMVWLIRVLIIGTFSVAGVRLFSQAEKSTHQYPSQKTAPPTLHRNSPSSNRTTYRPSPKPSNKPEPAFTAPEPTYHPVSTKSRNGSSDRAMTGR